jgi:exopolysaccharide biosynthesis polyprenyl glycosylphosphotransferase
MSTLNHTPSILFPRPTRLGIGSSSVTTSRLWRPLGATAWIDFFTVLAIGVIVFNLPSNGFIPSSFTECVSCQTSLVAIVCPVLFGAYFVLVSQLHGLYPQGILQSGLHEQRMTAQATLMAGLLLFGTLYLVPAYFVPRATVMLTVILALVILMLRRAIWRHMMKRHHFGRLGGRNVLIAGAGRRAEALREHLRTLRHTTIRFTGFISLLPHEDVVSHPDVVANLDDCVAVARALFVDEIYIAMPLDRNTVMSIAEQARSMGISVRVVPDLYDELSWSGRVEYIGQLPTIALGDHDVPLDALMLKRVMDVVLASAALFILGPLLLLIALLIWLDSRGPVLYRAERVGRKGCKFTCLKFRTMVRGADQRREELAHLNERKGVLFKMSNDPRVSRVGAFLRKYSLDETPQFINVLRGEMSLVGPRPPIASEVEQYQLAHLRRLDVLPGMTGLWQVEARQDPSFERYLSLDTAYVENWHLLLDLSILVRTVGVVLSGTGS